jgi:glycosyltransferase involved in cell wall biosynthesis
VILSFLIINDGSTDGSLDVLKQYAEIDSRIKIIDRENKGLVYSLNEGLSLQREIYCPNGC